jgi:hypothetical protein
MPSTYVDDAAVSTHVDAGGDGIAIMGKGSLLEII